MIMNIFVHYDLAVQLLKMKDLDFHSLEQANKV